MYTFNLLIIFSLLRHHLRLYFVMYYFLRFYFQLGVKIGTIVVEKKDDKIKAYSDVVKKFDLIIHDAGKEDRKLSTNTGRIAE